MNCINSKNLSKLYGSLHAVDKLDLSVDSGQIFGFLGPNGAGKSTTIKLLTALIPPSSGSLEILGIDASKNPLDVRKKIGVVLQQPSYEPTLSVEKSLEKYGMMWDVPKQERKKRMEYLLEAFDLENIRKRRNEDLSIGQRRRVQVAREFMHDMDLLFLDEPTVGLDPSARRKLFEFLKTKVKTGLTIFYTTHILSEAEYLCDKIAIIDKGKLLTVDSPELIKNKFGNKKTITINISQHDKEISSLLSDIREAEVDLRNETKIVVVTAQTELVLQKILKILNENNIKIEDISVIPTNLEDIFLKIIQENASNNSTS